jgi:hypothetical protein
MDRAAQTVSHAEQPKIHGARLSEATSGLKAAAGWTLSSTLMVGAAPVVRLMTQSLRCLMIGRNLAKGWTREESFASIFSIKDQISRILASAAIPVSLRNRGSPVSSQGHMSSYPPERLFVIA